MKRYRVILSDRALDGVREHLSYIAEVKQAPLAAQRWWRKALSAVESLERLPHRCAKAPENEGYPHTVRMLIVDRCLFLYRVDEETQVVRVLGFRHGSQEPRPLEECAGEASWKQSAPRSPRATLMGAGSVIARS